MTKRTWGTFASTDLDGQLRASGVTQVVIADRRLETHDYSIRNIFPRLGETDTAREIIDLLPTRSA